MKYLEALQGIACFGLLADYFEDRVDKFCALSIEALRVKNLAMKLIVRTVKCTFAQLLPAPPCAVKNVSGRKSDPIELLRSYGNLSMPATQTYFNTYLIANALLKIDLNTTRHIFHRLPWQVDFCEVHPNLPDKRTSHIVDLY